MTWIQTHSRKAFDLLSPRPEDVSIEDIAHALARICRWTGHTRTFYSVAQHSVLCATIAPRDCKLEALLHDAAEAYIGDISRPLKKMLGDQIQHIEQRIEVAIASAFGIAFPTPYPVKYADNMLLATEAEDLMGGAVDGWTKEITTRIWPYHIEPWCIDEAEHRFLKEFHKWKRNSPATHQITFGDGRDYQKTLTVTPPPT